MTEMRLQKYLSRAGLCSRRTAETWMQEGRVKVNGDACRELGTKVDSIKDRIEVDGKIVNLPSNNIYILLNKPQGYITSMHDPEGRPIITDLLPQNMPRVWPVGRLDWNSEGIILLTNDGKLTHLLTHPTHLVPKHYAVKVQGRLEQQDAKLTQLINGVDLGDDELTHPAFVQVQRTDRNTWLEVIIQEGRNRQIRRMFEAIGHPVMKLRRIGIGPLTIDGLRSGTFRSLNSAEVAAMYDALGAALPKEAEPSQRQIKRERQENTRSGNKSRRVSTKRANRSKSSNKPKSSNKSKRNTSNKRATTSRQKPSRRGQSGQSKGKNNRR